MYSKCNLLCVASTKWSSHKLKNHAIQRSPWHCCSCHQTPMGRTAVICTTQRQDIKFILIRRTKRWQRLEAFERIQTYCGNLLHLWTWSVCHYISKLFTFLMSSMGVPSELEMEPGWELQHTTHLPIQSPTWAKWWWWMQCNSSSKPHALMFWSTHLHIIPINPRKWDWSTCIKAGRYGIRI